MSNMSYCRFENTAADLSDCLDHMDDEDLSSYEIEGRKRIIVLCMEIALAYGSEITQPEDGDTSFVIR